MRIFKGGGEIGAVGAPAALAVILINLALPIKRTAPDYSGFAATAFARSANASSFFRRLSSITEVVTSELKSVIHCGKQSSSNVVRKDLEPNGARRTNTSISVWLTDVIRLRRIVWMALVTGRASSELIISYERKVSVSESSQSLKKSHSSPNFPNPPSFP